MKVPLTTQTTCISVLKMNVCRYSCDTSSFHVASPSLKDGGSFFPFFCLQGANLRALCYLRPLLYCWLVQDTAGMDFSSDIILKWQFLGDLTMQGALGSLVQPQAEPGPRGPADISDFCSLSVLKPSSPRAWDFCDFPWIFTRTELLCSSQKLSPSMKWAWSSVPGCAGMICSLAANKWNLEGSPDSRANLLFLTSTVCRSSGEMREDGGCKMQGERPEPAKTRFLVAPGDLKSGVVSLMHWGYSWFVLDHFVFKSHSPAKLQWGWAECLSQRVTGVVGTASFAVTWERNT